MRISRTAGALVAGMVGLVATGAAHACPFCAASSQTFSEEMDSMDVVVLARLAGQPPPPPASAAELTQNVQLTPFTVSEVIKGDEWAKPGQTIEALYFGQGKKGETFLIMGTDPPNVMWSTPLLLSERAVKYVQALPGLPADYGRLKFFQDYLEDPDATLATDAYDEFAKTPYDGVQTLKDDMDRDRLLGWIRDPDIPASRKRLYFTMLGVCGQPEDAALLETLMRSDDRKDKEGLDALIACYLILKGPEGLPLIEELFLKNPQAEYADTYSAIMALRFHGTETEVLPKARLLESMRYMLDRPELADLVIPDLARWEDWEVMPRLVTLFKEADEKSSWVRVPVINYLRACPLPEAEAQIAELEKIDPGAVRRASTFFPFGGLSPAASSSSDSAGDDGATDSESEQPEVPEAAPEADESAGLGAPTSGPGSTMLAQASPPARAAASGQATEQGEPGGTDPADSQGNGDSTPEAPAEVPAGPEDRLPEMEQPDPTDAPAEDSLEELVEPVEPLPKPARLALRVGVPVVATVVLAATMRGLLGGWST